MTIRPRRSRAVPAALALAVALALAACDASSGGGAAEGEATEPPSSSSRPGETPAQDIRVELDRPGPGPLPIDHRIGVVADGGSLEAVRVVPTQSDKEGGRLEGTLSEDGLRWDAQEFAEPGTAYVARGRVRRDDGSLQQVRLRFRTQDLGLDQLTFPSIAPLQGETVGVGMPVIVQFDLPVKAKAAFERRMTVRATPQQPGSWHWISDKEAHWRPKEYWKPGTRVKVDVDVNSVPAGGGIYGQTSRVVDFRVGDAVVSRLDVKSHTMKVHVNGRLARTMQVSAGKPGWETRSGTKVIIEKHRRKRMDAATIGVAEGDPEYYDIADVEYALRVTYSGEFLHAAPWSAGSQGRANVSHGCVGMSTADAAWLYGITHRGDVVEVTGSSRQMTLTNGYGDWNASFQEYRAGSALS